MGENAIKNKKGSEQAELKKENRIRLPIRQLVEFILRSGDIDSRYVEKDRMYEGAKAHRRIQKENAKNYEDYQSEISLSAEIKDEGILYTLEGRADGIFRDGTGVFIDEIKTTVLPLESIDEDFSDTHWAQAKCYAYIYADRNRLDAISVQLTYSNLDTQEIRRFVKSYEFGELQDFVTELIRKYAVWARLTLDWKVRRDTSIKALQFPFPEYRSGQRKLAVGTYRTIDKGGKLFAQAPTGIGKTISTLFPAVKSMGEGKISKIFYLTAKTITRQVAEEALNKMRSGDLRLKTLTLTAKEKICFCEKPVCNPEHCAYARGHYDRINDAILDAVTGRDDFTRTVIEEIAEKHRVCPFELALDISLWADCVICDYNYVFDPQTYLRRFFAENSGDYVFLIDEAHNLIDRSREMYSSELSKSHFYKVKKDYKGRNKALDRILGKMNQYMLELRKSCGEQGFAVNPAFPEELLTLLTKYVSVCETLLKENRELGEDSDFLQLYFEVLNFLLIADFYDERYVTLIDSRQKEVTVKLFCLDPSYLLSEALKRGKSAVLFSATLTPLEYFRDILGGGSEDWMLTLDSPFDSGNLCLMAADRVSTKFKDREQSRGRIAEFIRTVVSGKTGNYIVYFPSYQYMHSVFESFQACCPEFHAVEQQARMTEEMREEFIASFQEDPQQTFVAFCVLGGIFSEGIDLRGSRLIGSVIVSVGLPQLSVQLDLIRDYFNRKNGMGYEYAYRYPGMNKVLQAAGRVIRSEGDRGAVLLVDERFGHDDYKRIFPKHWNHCIAVRDSESIQKILSGFWA
jgi:Rad3-related DNA helicases